MAEPMYAERVAAEIRQLEQRAIDAETYAAQLLAERSADVMRVPMADRTAAIHAKYMAFGFSGPTNADRERDQVIGWLLDQLPVHDPAAKFAADMDRLRKNDPGGAQWIEHILTARVDHLPKDGAQ